VPLSAFLWIPDRGAAVLRRRGRSGRVPARRRGASARTPPAAAGGGARRLDARPPGLSDPGADRPCGGLRDRARPPPRCHRPAARRALRRDIRPRRHPRDPVDARGRRDHFRAIRAAARPELRAAPSADDSSRGGPLARAGIVAATEGGSVAATEGGLATVALRLYRLLTRRTARLNLAAHVHSSHADPRRRD